MASSAMTNLTVREDCSTGKGVHATISFVAALRSSDPSLSGNNMALRKAEMYSRSGWVAHHILLLITIGLSLTEMHPGVHAQECRQTSAEKCPSYTCSAPAESKVSLPLSLPREMVVVCRQTRAPDCVDILQFRSGSPSYYNSTFQGYVSLSSNEFTATLHRWLEGRYLIQTSMDKRCIANVDLATRNSATQTWSLSMGSLVAMCLLLVPGFQF
ncbi:hypothetical protein Y1Q_0006844 [Alligator mississippiensis]|uniref:Uncharacterized protein n=1 Tax=Alligator mississippiensis TaxID=8496 RepID=A0A151M5U0_ALLMI|nr:hypothetical protein Y1Q_0006844 [Alligator mississippiensis]